MRLYKILNRGGATIGQKCIIFDTSRTFIDPSRPWLISIGSYVKITRGVIILTHDYSLSTLRRVYGEWIGEGKVTSIGDNCFIGMNSIILMGTHIGNNVIVGAGSVVHGDVPDNVVIAGNPAKIICTLEEHYKNRLASTRGEALECASRYYEVFHKDPTPKDLLHFKFQILQRDKGFLDKYGLDFMCNGDEQSEVEKAFYSSHPLWNNYEDFLNEVHEKMKNRTNEQL